MCIGISFHVSKCILIRERDGRVCVTRLDSEIHSGGNVLPGTWYKLSDHVVNDRVMFQFRLLGLRLKSKIRIFKSLV